MINIITRIYKEYDIDVWCCEALENLVKKNRVIFFDKQTGQIKDSDENVFVCCPYCYTYLEHED